uniref:DUF834 domain-containing protein n=1 Tax=Oryza sativa subsp. japonica TaxID=39947 RepID=Q6UUE0_ORYSJ|nr:hypothetical protein OSJNBa0024A05.10 [Oryza sativa Japonica Group]
MTSSPAAQAPLVAGELGHGGANRGHQRDEHDAGNSQGAARPRTTMGNGRRRGRVSGGLRLDGVGGAPVGFGGNGGVDGVRLLLANPVIATATGGDHHGDGARRLKRLRS